MIMRQCRLLLTVTDCNLLLLNVIDDNTGTTLVGDVESGKSCTHMGTWSIWELCTFCLILLLT